MVFTRNKYYRAIFALITAGMGGLSGHAHSAENPVPALSVIKPATGCATLTNIDLTGIGGAGSKITSAAETTQNGAAFCVVEGTLAPAIGFRVALPMASWRQRFLQVGCGGLCGRIDLQAGAAAGCAPLNSNGFAIASTNMGHTQEEEDFGNDAQKRKDFAYRGVHLTAVVSKKIIEAFYHHPAAYAYFDGCSDGGREALMEAQRYPQDFNGVIAGAAAMNFQSQNALYHAWQAVTNTGSDGKAIITAAQLPLIHQAVLAHCDALDGQKDGLIADPQACHFDVSSLRCKAGDNASSCLSGLQVATLRRLYDGPRAEGSGQKMIVGGPQFGSELAWAGVFIPQAANDPIFSRNIALPALKTISFVNNPPAGYTLEDLRFTRETFDALRALHPLYDATNPDLSAFAAAGGKLIIWHGWADPHISPLNSVAYHTAVGKTLGEAKRDSFERLYLLPGMYHCSGGEGPSLLDLLTPMVNWVERGQAPQAITTWQAAPQQKNSFGQPMMEKGTPPPEAAGHQQPPMRLETVPANAASRPVFPYPDYAVYSGKGDVNRADSYVRKPLHQTYDTYHWLGEDFYTPYTFIE
ncbi:tannase/feruloyl esterase family alpha/beta hydrolase [Nissabacter archeti]|uniref:tannase/feruloyl esterase family alpha/beta hydrolase n=1 Tax=Nissabacter archeti TaxID=1917880 RepID=UPI0009324DC9|nr:tannase/feruloyl esterase family alpha/beta hydrolase [Nissabacter archeti]